jgi:hypothetical protein
MSIRKPKTKKEKSLMQKQLYKGVQGFRSSTLSTNRVPRKIKKITLKGKK